MKKQITLYCIFAVLIIANDSYAFIVDGFAYLQDETDHSGILVEFERTAPDFWLGSTTTNSDGYFSIEVALGGYTIKYSKAGFYDASIDQLINANITLGDITLAKYTSILHVPSQHATIQDAIEFSSNGDTVLVQPGTYYENIDFEGKDIVVSSLYLTTQDQGYITSTIIDANNSGCVATFASGESSSAVLMGFTLRGGKSDSYGGGVHCGGASNPIITNCTITSNSAIYGGGIGCIGNSNPTLKNLTVSDNTSIYAFI